MNLATYAAYGGDFQTAEREALTAQELEPMGLACLDVGPDRRRMAPGADTYEKLGKADELGVPRPRLALVTWRCMKAVSRMP